MAEILDLIAKVSWQTNQAELDKLNKALDKQDDALAELIRKGQRLEQARAKADNPAKVREINKQLEANKKAMDSLTKATENQGKATLDLVKKQKELAKAINETTDPKQVRQLLSEFKKVEQQLKTTEKSAGGLKSAFGNVGQSILGGLGLGVGSLGLESLVSGIASFVSSANQEFIDAENTTLRFQNTLKSLGQEQYFDELTAEADALAKQIGYLDNDDIVSAQEKMLTYGKLSKNEISQLLPVIIDLSARMGTDVPSATETMINILEGRGGATLRQLGLTIKDANTTTERLGVVFEELGPKIAGSAEAVRNSSDGMRRALNQQIADLEESVGASTIKLQNFFLGAYAGFLTMLKKFSQSEEEERKENTDKYFNDRLADAKKLSDKELEFEKTLLQTKIDDIKVAQSTINKLEAENAKSGLQYIGKLRENENNKQIRAQKDFVSRREAEVQAIINEANTRDQRKQEEALITAKRNAEDRANAEKESAEKRVKVGDDEAKRLMALRELLKKDRQELDQFYLSADQKEIARVNQKYDELAKQAKGHADLLKQIAENRESALLQIERKKSFEMTKLDFSATQEMLKNDKEKQKSNAETYAKEFGLMLQKQQDDILDKQQAKQRQAEELQMLFEQAQVAASVAQDLISIEQEKNDRLIGLQQERIASARESASVSLKIEEDRLQELLEKRQRYERAQRTIDAAVIVANQAVAISQAIRAITTSSTLGPAGIAANVIAIIAGLASSLAAVRSATADIPQFREGGYTGDGSPDSVSTTLGARPYTYHKREFVMDEELTSKHRDLFEGLHKRDMVVKKLDDGQFYITRNGLDTTRLIDDHISIKNQMQTEAIVYQLNAINERLSQREVSITNTFDSNGFGNVIATQLGRIQINKKLR